jgi:hypothetical protein
MDTTVSLLIVIVVFAVALWFGIRWAVRAFSRYRGPQIVTCPETKDPAIVEVDSLHASLTAAVGLPDIRLENCSRWPMKKECGQECLMELDVAPGECLVSGVLMRWYRDKNCVYCKKAFPDLQWLDHRPALLSPERKLLSWNQVHLDELRSVLETHYPVCWDCYITQSFRVDHPDLVVLRPWRQNIDGDADGSSASRHP